MLGAAPAASGAPSRALRRRVEHGASIFAARNAEYLLVSGGVVGPPPAEAHVMYDLAVERGVSPERIIVEDRARNTFENAVYAGKIIREHGWRQVLIVTDSFHLPRALYVFRRIGLDVAGEGVPRPSAVSRPSWAREHIEERLRLIRSAGLFAMGAHRPMLAEIWGSKP